jgi:hypothetical protein
MAVIDPLCVFEKDDQSMRLVEEPSRLHELEPIDVANDEYVFWDSNGDAASVAASVTSWNGKIGDLTSGVASLSLREAFRADVETLDLADFAVDGRPGAVWRRMQYELASRAKKRRWFSA